MDVLYYIVIGWYLKLYLWYNYWFIGIMLVYNVFVYVEGLWMKFFFIKDLNCYVENVIKYLVLVVCLLRIWEEFLISKRCFEICFDIC